MTSSCHPPLGADAQAALGRIPDGAAVHLAMVSVVCNDLHRYAGPVRALDCARCRFRAECCHAVDEAVLYISRFSAG